jgi:hypothetical protein
VTRGLGLGWWSVAYDSLPLARDAAEDRRNVHLASDFDSAMRSLGFCIATAGALTHERLQGHEAGIKDGLFLGRAFPKEHP